ncbi:hypothetical protein SALBM311S_11700 [Streptomyces alboniger]
MTSSALRGVKNGMFNAARVASLAYGSVEDFDDGVVTHEGHHPAAGVSPVHVGVTDGVRGAVEAWPLPVPDTHDPIDRPLVVGERQLRTPDRRRRQFLVDPGGEVDAVVLTQARDGLEQTVEAA